MLSQFSNRMTARSAALLLAIDNRLESILKYWLLIAGFASAARIFAAPHALRVSKAALKAAGWCNAMCACWSMPRHCRVETGSARTRSLSRP